MTTHPVSADQQGRLNDRSWRTMFVVVLAACAGLGVLTLQVAPNPLPLALVVLGILFAAVVVKPAAGIYISAFFIAATDPAISAWYPFGKNLSSRESILFIADGLIISPLELVLALTTASWLVRLVVDHSTRRFVAGRLLRPLGVFTGFLLLGLAWGLGRGGDRYVAVWELRPILYLPVLYVLITNLFTSRAQYHRLAIAMAVALVIHSLLSLQFLTTLTQLELDELETLVTHTSAVQFNLIFVVLIAALVLPGRPRLVRTLMLVAAVPVTWVYLVSQRRASVIALAAAVILIGALLFHVDRRRFRRVAPIVALVVVGYLGAFWSAEGPFGFPAQAIKSVIAAEETSEQDQSSNIYRAIENIDTVSTIRAEPLTGVGFGQRFLAPYPLPDISFFPFYEYIPHNTVLWIWMKAGLGGFVTMLYLFARSIRSGVRAVLHLPAGKDALLVVAATSYIVMYLVFAYVDMAWDGRSMVFLAVSMAICSELTRLPVLPPPVVRPERLPIGSSAPRPQPVLRNAETDSEIRAT